jgi:hypothetical protein
MTRPLSISLLFASFALAGCVETSATKTGRTPAVTGGDLIGVPARACRAAIAKTMNRPESDVTVFAVKESAAGSQVEAKVTGALALHHGSLRARRQRHLHRQRRQAVIRRPGLSPPDAGGRRSPRSIQEPR